MFQKIMQMIEAKIKECRRQMIRMAEKTDLTRMFLVLLTLIVLLLLFRRCIIQYISIVLTLMRSGQAVIFLEGV